MIYAYVRVSTIQQDNDRQLDQLKDYKIDQMIQEKQSGKNIKDRPQLTALLDSLVAGDKLIVYSMDRLARDLDHLRSICKNLVARDVTVMFIKEGLTFDNQNSVGLLMLSIIGAVAEFERSLILERCNQGRELAKANGVKFGSKGKLTEEQRKDIYNSSLSTKELATKFNMSYRQMHRIKKNDKDYKK